ncbi:MAG: hypothetical protein WD270_07775 [Acetobacterales bacterium]
MTLIVPSEKLAGLITLESAIDAVAEAYRATARQPGFSATHTRLHYDGRRLTVHPGGSLPDRMAGLFAHFERLDFGTSAQGYTGVGRRVYAAYDTETAELAAVILGSLPLFPFEGVDAFGTETAITSAVGTRLLGRAESRTMALLGTGRQARRHLLAMARLFPLTTIRVYSRDPENVERFCTEMSAYVDVRLVPATGSELAVAGADLVICATASNVPVLNGECLSPGAHVTSIVNGNRIAVRPGEPPRFRREVDDATVRRADVICAVMPEQAIKDEQGDLAEPVLKGLIQWRDVRDLGCILDGTQNGRTDKDQITLFKQNSDQGVGFMALARLALEAAREHGIGVTV